MLLPRKLFRPSFFLLLSGILIFLSITLLHSPHFSEAPQSLALAITLDLTATLTGLFYFLLIRPYRLHPSTMAPVFAFGILSAHLLIPKEFGDGMKSIQALAACFEFGITGFILYNLKNVIKDHRQLVASGFEFSQALRKALARFVPNAWIASLISTEVSLLRYGLFTWSKTLPETDSKEAFSHWKNSGWSGVLIGFILMIVFEGVAFHFLLAHWGTWLIVIHHLLSAYSILWLLGDYQAIRHHPIQITAPEIRVQIGFRWSIIIPTKAITKIELRGSPEVLTEVRRDGFIKVQKVPGYKSFTVFGEPELQITLRHPVVAHGLFGVSQQVTMIGLAPDDCRIFKERVETLAQL